MNGRAIQKMLRSTTRPATAVATTPPPVLDHLHLAELARIERHLESILRDLRAYRTQQQQASADQGVLGSRGLTQFVLDQLKALAGGEARVQAGDFGTRVGKTVTDLLLAAENAGYAIPTKRTLSKRLVERRYRVGDIDWQDTDSEDRNKGYWYWKGTKGD